MRLFPTLQTIMLPDYLWDDGSVLQGVHEHPSLDECIFRRFSREVAYEPSAQPYPDMSRTFWLYYTVVRPSLLAQSLQAGARIQTLIHNDITPNLDWTHLKFPNTLRSIDLSEDISPSFWPLVWDFVMEHQSVQELNLYTSSSTTCFIIEKVEPGIAQIFQDSSLVVSSARLKRVDGMWGVRELELRYHCDNTAPLQLRDFSARFKSLGCVLKMVNSLSLHFTSATGGVVSFPHLPLEVRCFLT